MTARLLIGPLLRRVVGTRATVWVETSAPAVVRVRAGAGSGEAPTFTAFGHHYALVVVDGLAPGTATPYQVFLDDQRVWPEPAYPYPESVIRTRGDAAGDDAGEPVRLVFGSCRETTQRVITRRLPPDALDAYARRLMRGADEPLPDLLVLLGDQVYADAPSPAVRPSLRHDEVISYEEYTRLYLESWRDAEIRWLLATVPSVMIFDDHEIIDDWNSSAAWRSDIRQRPWWPERIASGLASYWVYQHLGNLSPDEIAADPVYQKVLAAEDATGVLREFGAEVDRVGGYRWSYALDVGNTRLVVLDNRCDRVLDEPQRAMLPAAQWRWLTEQTRGRYDHLLVGSSLPWLLPPAIHDLEAWNERAAGSHRAWVARLAERVRRAFDLEHWAAIQHSFTALADLLASVAAGGRASVSVLSGDVHHSYVARVAFRAPVATPVYQLTCSPVHNNVPGYMRPMLQVGWWRAPAAVARALARLAGVAAPVVQWRRIGGPYFGNAIGTLVHDGRSARVTIEGTTPEGDLHPVIHLGLS